MSVLVPFAFTDPDDEPRDDGRLFNPAEYVDTTDPHRRAMYLAAHDAALHPPQRPAGSARHVPARRRPRVVPDLPAAMNEESKMPTDSMRDPTHTSPDPNMDGGDQGFPTQADTLAWVAARWPDRTTPIWRAAKLCEEAGEVMGAVIKTDEGRKTAADVAQETAQVVICAMALAESVGFDLFGEVAKEYQRCIPGPTEKCPQCRGGGTHPDHDRGCPGGGPICEAQCPVEVHCDLCRGTGQVPVGTTETKEAESDDEPF